MSSAVLTIGRTVDGFIQYKLATGKRTSQLVGPSPAEQLQLERLGQQIAQLGYGEGTDAALKFADLFVRTAISEPVGRALRQWALSEPGESTLCLEFAAPGLERLPWEVLVSALGVPGIFIARLVDPAARSASAVPTSPEQPVPVLVTGWSKLPGLPQMPGVERELAVLPTRLRDERVEVWSIPEPTPQELLESFTATKPAIVHLVTPGIQNIDDEPHMAASDENGDLAWLKIRELAQALAGHSSVRLVCINSCNGGLGAARLFGERLGATAIGWAGMVPDELAADFALFFYQRLLEGESPVRAVRSFLNRDSLETPLAGSPIPVLWLPDLKSLDQVLFERSSAELRTPSSGIRRAGRGSQVAPDPVDGERPPLDVTIEFSPFPALNPALISNGRPVIDRLTLTTSKTIEGLRLQIECDTGTGRSTARQILQLAPGTTPVTTTGVTFPVLHQLIEAGARRRQVNFVVTASTNDRVVAELTRSVLWMGPREWMDRPETWPFIPAFVQPNSEAVLEIISHAEKVLRQAGGPEDAFDGYQSNDPEMVDRQMRAIFTVLRGDPYELGYIGPPGNLVYMPDSPSPTGQQVRLPDDVIKHRRGTCHDLALLLASCAEQVGIHPLIVLKSGHTFFGYWTSSVAHERFWNAERPIEATAGRGLGTKWTIAALSELSELLETNVVTFVEATDVTNRNARFEEACQNGTRIARELTAQTFDIAVDLTASRHAVQPIEVVTGP